MAQIGSVNATFTASVGGLTAGVDAAGKAFKALGGDTATLRSALSSLNTLAKQDFLAVGPAAGAAKAAFDQISASVASLGANFRSGAASSGEFATGMAALTAQAKQMAQATADAAAITRENTTAEQDYFAALDRITNAVRNGGLAEEVATRAREAALQSYLRSTDAINRQADATTQLGDATAAINFGDLGGQLDAITGFAAAFSASVEASDSFIAATEGVSAAVEQQATALEIAKIAAEERAAMVARAAEIERASMTATQAHAAAIEELDTLYGAGVLSADAYAAATARQDAALAQADGSAAAAAAAIESLSAAHARGAAVAQANMTAEERYASEIADLNDLLRQGAISQETFDRASAAAASRMRQAATAGNELSGSLGGITSRLNVLIGLDVARLFSSIASSISGTVRSFISMGQAEAGVIDQTSKLAERLGLTYGELAGLGLAAEKSGVSMDAMKDAMTKADVAFVNAANGSAQAAAAFERIGLSAAQLNGMGTADRFQAIAKSIAALPTEAERAAAAVQIFGRSGADLLPLFEGGAEGIAAARAEAERLGLTLTDAQGKDVQKMVSAFEQAQNAIQGVVQQVVAYLAPAVTGVVEQFNKFIGDIGGANIGQMIGNGILDGAEYLASVADWMVSNLGGVWDYVSQVGEQWNAVMDFAYRVGQAFYGAFKLFEFVGNTIGGAISDIVGMLLSGAATIAGYIPGMGEMAKSLNGAADYMKGQADNYLAAANENLAASGQAFKNAFGEASDTAGQKIVGPFQKAIQDFRNTAQASATSTSEAAKKPVEIKQPVEVNISQALKAIDSRSSAGVAEMFRLMRGDTGNVQEQQLSALEKIVENTSGLEDIPAVSLAGA